MKKVIVIYDDSLKPNKEIRSITGDKSYGDTIFKRVTLKNRMREEIEKNKNVVSMYSISDERENEKLKEELTKMAASYTTPTVSVVSLEFEGCLCGSFGRTTSSDPDDFEYGGKF